MADAAGQSQPTNAPTNKTWAASVGSALGVLAVWTINKFLLPDDPLPVGVEAAITTLITFALAWIVPPGARERVIVTATGARSATA